MVELPWGLKPKEPGGEAIEFGAVPKGGCFVAIGAWCPPPEFQLTHRGRRLNFSLADGDWFYFAGIWRPASHDWPETYAVVTIEANGDVRPIMTGRWPC